MTDKAGNESSESLSEKEKNTGVLQALLVEDNEAFLDILSQRLITDKVFRYGVHTATSLEGSLEILRKQQIDVILLDLTISDSQGRDTLEAIRVAAPACPIVVLTGVRNHEMAIESIRSGAQDYLFKGEFDGKALPRILRHAVERFRLQEVLKKDSFYDEMTGLYNRRGFFAAALQQLKLAKREEKPVMLFLFDLDDLKVINDTHGHLRGDSAIKTIALILSKTFRESDIIVRLGGDEFAAMAVNADRVHLPLIRERLRKNLEDHNRTSSLPLSLSQGVSFREGKEIAFMEQLISEADKALYAAKKKKKGKAVAHGVQGGAQKKILIIEDDKVVKEMLKSRLRGLGFEIATASDGEDGLLQIPSFNPDLVFLDIKMPNKDGWTFVKDLKKMKDQREIPVVVITGRPDMKDLFAMEGVRDYIIKPYKPEDILAVVKKYL